MSNRQVALLGDEEPQTSYRAAPASSQQESSNSNELSRVCFTPHRPEKHQPLHGRNRSEVEHLG